MNYALVIIPNDPEQINTGLNPVYKEFESFDDLPELLREVEKEHDWGSLSIIHIEMLPVMLGIEMVNVDVKSRDFE